VSKYYSDGLLRLTVLLTFLLQLELNLSFNYAKLLTSWHSAMFLNFNHWPIYFQAENGSDVIKAVSSSACSHFYQQVCGKADTNSAPVAYSKQSLW